MDINLLLYLILAYLIGSFPSAVVFGKVFKGVDVREFGSKNAGATNTFRVLGKQIGIPVLLVDVAKGFFSTQLVNLTELNPARSEFVVFQILLGTAAVLGHIFPLFAGFRGGKGVATLFGMVISINPYAALISSVFFILVLVITRYVSLSSIIASLAFCVIVIVFHGENRTAMLVFSVLQLLLLLYTHRDNLKRIRRGEENKVYLYKKSNQK